MNIAVCMKVVPNSEQYDKIMLDPVRKTIVREGIASVINSADLHAIELALQLKETNGGKITIVSMGPDSIIPQLREALSYGCDEAYLISDRKFGGADSLATAYTLTATLNKIGKFDLVLLGNVSEDGATAHVPSQLGEYLSLPHITDITKLSIKEEHAFVEKDIGGAVAEYIVKLPALFGIDRKMNKVRHPNVMGIFSAKKKPLVTYSAADFEAIDASMIGLSGSPTQPGAYRDIQYCRECAELKSVEELIQAISKARS